MMDELDRNLLEAWGRVVAELRADPDEARQRWRRSRGKTLRRPPRAWCLQLRASDTRIGAWDTEGDIEAAVRDGEGFRGAGHGITLSGSAVRSLCGPVRIPYPGVKLKDAAAMLGRHPEALRHWLPAAARPGRTRQVRAHKAPRKYEVISEPGKVFSVRYEAARCHGHNGVDVPVVWSPRLINPGAVGGQGPHAVWGSMWESLRACVPDGYELRVERVPRVRPRKGEMRFSGWDFKCPGRFDVAAGRHVGCGKKVQALYLPLPVFTVGRWLDGGDGAGIDVSEPSGSVLPPVAPEAPEAPEVVPLPPEVPPEVISPESGGLRLSGDWYPGVGDAQQGRRSFACGGCWDVRNFTLADYRGWNEFVSYLSGGLLFGHEVQRPGWFRYERKHPRTRPRKLRESGVPCSAKPQAACGEMASGGIISVGMAEV